MVLNTACGVRCRFPERWSNVREEDVVTNRNKVVLALQSCPMLPVVAPEVLDALEEVRNWVGSRQPNGRPLLVQTL